MSDFYMGHAFQENNRKGKSIKETSHIANLNLSIPLELVNTYIRTSHFKNNDFSLEVQILDLVKVSKFIT